MQSKGEILLCQNDIVERATLRSVWDGALSELSELCEINKKEKKH